MVGPIAKVYLEKFVCRYDKEVGVPYYSVEDFKGFKREASTFNNSKGIEIHYFFYYYDNYRTDRIILFCPGLGPGHASYMAEIETLAKRGYRVLTIDYTGCGESNGDNMGSLNFPTRDVMELLDLLKLEQEIIIMGHSLGGFTALKVASLRKEITKVVVMSPILAIKPMMLNSSKSKFITYWLMRYEQKVAKEYNNIDVPKYLGSTSDNILFIQSVDDPMVPYETSLKIAEEAKNPHIKTIKMEGRKHNPNYTEEAVQYMNQVFGAFNRRVMDKKIASDEERIAYFKDVSIARLTEQDQKLFDQIFAFIN
ncbi:MAG: alpha/beta fold hydrolase [Bacilli bacterium]|nr:alpha/beta fold hydrolase [Bacilli bacterium]